MPQDPWERMVDISPMPMRQAQQLKDILFLRERGLLHSNAIVSPVLAWAADNLDATHTFAVQFRIPAGTVEVLEMNLSFWLAPFRTYDQTAGIVDGDSPTGVQVWLNGSDRTSDLGGGTGFSTDQAALDVNRAGWLIVPGANVVSFSSPGKGHVRAQVDGRVLGTLRR